MNNRRPLSPIVQFAPKSRRNNKPTQQVLNSFVKMMPKLHTTNEGTQQNVGSVLSSFLKQPPISVANIPWNTVRYKKPAKPAKPLISPLIARLAVFNGKLQRRKRKTNAKILFSKFVRATGGEKTFITTLVTLKQKTRTNPRKIMAVSLNRLRPLVKTNTQIRAGKLQYFPAYLTERNAYFYALKFLKEGAIQQPQKIFANKIAAELLDVMDKRGLAMREKRELLKQTLGIRWTLKKGYQRYPRKKRVYISNYRKGHAINLDRQPERHLAFKYYMTQSFEKRAAKKKRISQQRRTTTKKRIKPIVHRLIKYGQQKAVDRPTKNYSR